MKIIFTQYGLMTLKSLFTRIISLFAVTLLLVACASRMDGAPIVDRSIGHNLISNEPAPIGYYRIKPGDTLYRIALDHHQNYQDISTWNNLQNPNQIEVGQLVRVVAPGTQPEVKATTLATASPVVTESINTAPLVATSSTTTTAPVTEETNNIQPLVTESDSVTGSEIPKFVWPAKGPILERFDNANNKGINIGGNSGEAILAVADGRVVYAGDGLKGYGNLIVVKHNNTYLTAYAHNRALLVKDGEAVTKGQKIAEMGNSGADKVMLHFEVRKNGKPVDPLTYLPKQ